MFDNGVDGCLELKERETWEGARPLYREFRFVFGFLRPMVLVRGARSKRIAVQELASQVTRLKSYLLSLSMEPIIKKCSKQLSREHTDFHLVICDFCWPVNVRRPRHGNIQQTNSGYTENRWLVIYDSHDSRGLFLTITSQNVMCPSKYASIR